MSAQQLLLSKHMHAVIEQQDTRAVQRLLHARANPNRPENNMVPLALAQSGRLCRAHTTQAKRRC